VEEEWVEEETEDKKSEDSRGFSFVSFFFLFSHASYGSLPQQ
jgi:hypothetical protein